jgi:Tol biopolymer transport system component
MNRLIGMASPRGAARTWRLAALAGVVGLTAAACSIHTTKAREGTPAPAAAPGPVAFVATGHGLAGTNVVAVSPLSGRARPITRGGPPVVDAAWSADGRELVFVRRGRSRFEVFVARRGGRPRAIRRCSLTCDPRDFAWSPDGRRIAFVTNISSRFTGTAGEIAVMNAGGSGFRAVCAEVTCGQGLADPQWSPDGSRLLFSNMDVIDFFGMGTLPSRIWVARPDGAGAQALTQPHCRPGHPPLRGCFYDSAARWSPDGRWIAFSRHSEPFGRGHPRQPWTTIELRHPDGSGLHTLARCTGGLCNQIMTPAWSPDGSRLAYIPRVERSANIIVATPAGHLTVVRACAGRRCITPDSVAWAPGGSELALQSATKDPGAYVLTPAGRDLRAVGRDVQCCLTWIPSPGS